MAPVDPGPAISWSRRPLYTTSLLAALSNLPRPDAHLLLSIHLAPLTKQERTKRLELLPGITSQVFTVAGAGAVEEDKRRKSQQTSIGRRLQTIAKDYDTNLKSLRGLQGQERTDFEADLRLTTPWHDTLHGLLHDHPQHSAAQAAPPLGGGAQPAIAQPAAVPVPPAAVPVPPPRAAPAPAPQRRSPPRHPHPDDDYWNSEDDDDYMAGVEYAERFIPRAAPQPQLRRQPAVHPAPAPAPAPQGRQQPVAGPAFPRLVPRPPPLPVRTPTLARRLPAQGPLFGNRFYGDLTDEQPGRALGRAPAARVANTAAPQPAAAHRRSADVLLIPRSPSPPPAAEPAPPPARARSPTPGLDGCPNCAVSFVLLSAEEAQDHLRQCLDGEGGTLPFCPVCEKDLGPLMAKARERHVDECCTTGSKVIGNTTERSREWAEFQPDDKTLPKDPSTGEAAECGVCFEDFALSDLLVRLSCYCVFHKGCMVKWWESPGAFCPMHRDDRVTGTDYDVVMH